MEKLYHDCLQKQFLTFVVPVFDMDIVRIARRVASRSDVLNAIERSWGAEGMPPMLRGGPNGPWEGQDDFGRDIKIVESPSGNLSVTVGHKLWNGSEALHDAVEFMKTPPPPTPEPKMTQSEGWLIIDDIYAPQDGDPVSEKDLLDIYLPNLGSKRFHIVRVNPYGQQATYSIQKYGAQKYEIISRGGSMDLDFGIADTPMEVLRMIKADIDSYMGDDKYGKPQWSDAGAT
jgi:hypothetical protein